MHYRSMTLCWAVLIFAAVSFFDQSPLLRKSYAQQRSAVETDSSRLQFNNGPRIQSNHLTLPARVLNKAVGWDSKKQIQVKIKLLLMSDELRAAVYKQLNSDSIEFESQSLPGSERPAIFATSGTDLQSSRNVTTTSCVATSVLTQQFHEAILTQVAQSTGSKVLSSPTIILLDGNEGQLDDFVQRPFVVGLPPVGERVAGSRADKSKQDWLTGRPAIQVVDEGHSVRVRAIARDDAKLHLASEIIKKKLVGVEEVEVLGFQSNATLQRPIHQVESVVVSAEMTSGQTLLVDPYMSSEIVVKAEQGVPLLGKIPYLSHSFKNTAAAVTKANWMVMIQAQIQASPVQQVTATEPIENR